LPFGVLLGMYTSPLLTLRRGAPPSWPVLARSSPAGALGVSGAFFRAGTARLLRDPVGEGVSLFAEVVWRGADRTAFCRLTGAGLLDTDWVRGLPGGLWDFFGVFSMGGPDFLEVAAGPLAGAGLGPAGAASPPSPFAPNSWSSCLKRFSNISRLSGPGFFLEEPGPCFFVAMGQSSCLGGPVIRRERGGFPF